MIKVYLTGLETIDPLLSDLLTRARKHDDSEAGLALLRKFAELLSRRVASHFGLRVGTYNNSTDLLHDLRQKVSRKDRSYIDALHRLRKAGNQALHDPDVPQMSVLKECIKDADGLAEWLANMLAAETQHCRSDEQTKTNTSTALAILPPLQQAEIPVGQDPWVQLTQEGIAILESFGVDSSNVVNALDQGHDAINQARAPFRLGIVGEFRVGKSTLINALAGTTLAPVGEVETTHVITRFRHADRAQAVVRFLDGRTETMSIEDAQILLNNHRDDPTWSMNVDHVDLQAPLPNLGNLELWDAPGLGGSDTNEVTANRFINMIGGAVWLFDADLLGDDTVMSPLRRLNRAGKVVLGAINRVDELDSEQIEEAIEFMREMCGELVQDIIAISALQMAQGGLQAQKSFRQKIEETILKTAEVDREQRVSAALGQAMYSCGAALAIGARRLRDRAGLSAFLRDSIEAAFNRTLSGLEAEAEAIVKNTFIGSERHARREINLIFSNTDGPPSEKAIDQLLTELDQSTSLEKSWPIAVGQMIEAVESRWTINSREALSLTRAAIPPARFESIKVPTLEDSKTAFETEIREDAKGTGLTVGAFAAGSFSAIVMTTPITWPLVLAAIPLGIFAAGSQAAACLKRYRIDLTDVQQKLVSLVNQKRAALLTAMERELPEHLRAVLTAHVRPLLTRVIGESLGTEDVAIFGERLKRLEAIIVEMQTLVNDTLDNPNNLPPIVEPDDVEIPPGSQAGPALARLLAGAHGGIDIITHDADPNVAILFMNLPTGLDVRWIATSDTDESSKRASQMRALATGWPGRLSIRVVSDASDQALAIDQVTIISSGAAWQCSVSDFFDLGRRHLTLQRTTQGVLSAKRRFAELWTGLAHEGRLKVEVG